MASGGIIWIMLAVAGLLALALAAAIFDDRRWHRALIDEHDIAARAVSGAENPHHNREL